LIRPIFLRLIPSSDFAMSSSIEKVQEILNSKLKGGFISKFSVGDTWDLYIGGYYLVAQNVVSEDEEKLNQLFQDHYSSYYNCVDQMNISKSTIVAAHLRKIIARITLDQACNLTIEFEDDNKLVLTANETIVDWQWALNESGKGPYSDFTVGCFWEGEVEINPTSIA
jgi:hypothetical protein